MKTITIYQSILGHKFNTPEEAMADEDRLPRIIATYEKDLEKFVTGGKFAGKVLDEVEAADLHLRWTESVKEYKAQWAEVQAQRENPNI